MFRRILDSRGQTNDCSNESGAKDQSALTSAVVPDMAGGLRRGATILKRPSNEGLFLGIGSWRTMAAFPLSGRSPDLEVAVTTGSKRPEADVQTPLISRKSQSAFGQ